MDHTSDDMDSAPTPTPTSEPERIEIAGLGGSLSAAALRALLDPATRDEAVIDIDLSQLAISIPAASVRAVLAQFLPDGGPELGAGGVTIRPGGGSPGVRIAVPANGVRIRVGADGVRVGGE